MSGDKNDYCNRGLCLNIRNRSTEGGFIEVNGTDTCKHFKIFEAIPKLEWDEGKNDKNKKNIKLILKWHMKF